MKIEHYNNLLELFYNQFKQERSDQVFLQSLKNPNQKFTWEQTYLNILKLSDQLESLMQNNDRCLLISENRPEWMVSDLAIMLANGITVPAYTTYTESDYEYLIDDCKPSVIIISDKTQYDKVKNIIKKRPFIKSIISFEEFQNDNEIIFIKEIFNKKEFKEKDLLNLKIKRTDVACIIYTSGTQGNPKGVMLSHGGILSNCEGSIYLLKEIISEKPKFLTWLPLSHSYEHTVQFVQIAIGAKVFYAESIDKLIKNMNDCNPDIMTAVPRFYQNLFQKISSNFNKVKGFKKYLISKMLVLGKKKLLNEKLSFFENIENLICEKLVRKKIKSQFGGALKAFISGGGALDKEVGIFLNSIGLPTLQGYGLTETSPVVSCNPINDIRIETVGPPFRNNKVKIVDDGEILIKGENVMLGYWNKKEETDAVIIDGWLHTGDIGEIDSEDGYLKITDRKKDIIVSAGGDNISPAKIENMITNESEIDQCMVYGDKKNYLVALIVPSKDFLHEKKKINNVIEKINKKLTLLEKIKKIQLIDENFSIENGLMTPTMKVKRKKVTEKYKNQLEKLY
jgi:long-chain acyl-CoA synthetase